MSASPSSSARDPRVDFMRGLALLSIFVDHIPKNRLADYTLHNYGLSDAAELFVILAGFSAASAYTGVFERDGLRVGIVKVLSRCLQIYGVQVALLLSTWVFVSVWQHVYGLESLILGPMLRDGWKGAVRGITLTALPAYLDILPLYIVLLGSFPVIRFGMARNAAATVAASFLIYAGANLFHWNLPNVVDPADAAHWYFDPFTWQFVFVLGCWLASATRRRLRVLTAPPRWLMAAAWIYALGAFVAVDAWQLWPKPFGLDINGLAPAITVLGNEPKTYVSPWRLLNILAWTYLVLTSPAMTTVARWRILRPVVACGRHSLQVFAAGCVLSLLGRLIFRSHEITALSQTLVNAIGILGLLAVGVGLDRLRAGRVKTSGTGVPIDAERAIE